MFSVLQYTILILYQIRVCLALPQLSFEELSRTPLDYSRVLILQKFQLCDVLVSRAVTSSNSSSSEGESKIRGNNLIHYVDEFIYLTGKELFVTNFGEAPFLKPFDPNKNVVQKSDHCVVTVNFIPSNANVDSYFLDFERTLLSHADPFVKKDEDYHIFLSDGENPGKESLFFHSTAMDLKFKILLENERDMRISTLCFYCDQGRPQFIQIPQSLEVDQLFPDFVNNGHGHTLRASSQTKLLFMMEIEKIPTGGKGQGKWQFKRGQYWTMFKVLLDKYNFTYVTFPAHGGGGSGTLKKGVWHGAVRDIIDGRADVSMATTTDYARFQVVGGSKPISFIWVNFILGEPHVTYSWHAIFWPLDSLVWIAMGIANLVMLAAFKILGTLEAKVTTGNGVDHKDTFNRGLGLEEQYILALLLEQHVDFPKTQTSRFLFLSWVFTSVVLATAYRSVLVGLMTCPMMDTQPETYAELASTKGYTWGLESSTIGSSGHNFFLISPDPLYQRIYHHMEFEYDTGKCFRKAVHSKYACLAFNEQAEYMIYRNFSHGGSQKIPMKLSRDYVGYSMPAIAMRKRALYRTNFDRVIEVTREMGVVEKWRWMDYANERKKHSLWKKANHVEDSAYQLDNEEEAVRPLSMAQVRGPFIVIFMGSVTGALSWVFESNFKRAISCLADRKAPKKDDVNANALDKVKGKGKGKKLRLSFRLVGSLAMSLTILCWYGQLLFTKGLDL